MERTELIMGMPITIKLARRTPGDDAALDEAFDYFRAVDARFSTYKPDSEISRINAGLPPDQWSDETNHIFELCEQTKRETNGYFDILHDGKRDPSGIVKGWAIQNAAQLLKNRGLDNFYVDAGGDIQPVGHNAQAQPWRFGIRNPFDATQIVKTVQLARGGLATSGSYVRGQHIYNPFAPGQPITDIMSLSVIGPNVYDADRFATAAFAMGKAAITFIEQLKGYEGYMIDSNGIATMTRGFEEYVA